MTCRTALRGLPLMAATVVVSSFAGCSSDDTANGGATENTGGVSIGTGGLTASGGLGGAGGAKTGGATGSGGAAGSGGGSGTGGGPIGAGGDLGDAGKALLYVCEARPPRDPGGSGAVGASCCGGKGSCASNGSPNPELGHDTCGTSLFCEPTSATFSTAGAFTTCRSRIVTSLPGGLEGRCVPKCFTLGNPQSVVLDGGGTPGDGGQTECGTDEVCAPCFSPVDGKATGACSMKPGDSPAEAAPAPYEECPDGNDAGQKAGGGLCLPGGALAALTNKANPYYNPSIPGLKQDNCAAGEKCVPAKKVADPGYCFPRCSTSNFTVISGGQDVSYRPGACSPAYVIFDVAGAVGITVSTGGGPCEADSLCAPCKSPITTTTANMGDPSGACY